MNEHPAKYAGKQVTTQGYYFWSPATSGLLVEKIDRERGEVVRSVSTDTNPKPDGIVIVLEGFPPALASKGTIGPSGSYIWGLVEVTGMMEVGGAWGPFGAYHLRITIVGSQVKILGK